ncbi:MAG: GntR family transcriptional regulator [Anaerocolumna sp.]
MFLENKRLDKTVPIPLYFQLKELIVNEIKNGDYEDGSLIPTEKELSASFKISRTTVRQAITELVQEGWLYRIKSKGTFISKPKSNQDFVQKLETFNDQIVKLGQKPTTEVLEFKIIVANKIVATKLELNEGEQVIYLYRKRFADANPVVLVETYLPFKSCSFLLSNDLNNTSLYSLLSEHEETSVYGVNRLIEAVEANTNDSNHLNIKRGKPILLFNSVAYNIHNEPIEYSIARYRGDRNQFEINVMADNK